MDLAHLALALAGSWAAGMNLYATVAVLGLLHRFTVFELPPSLEVLANPWVLGAAAVFYVVEFVADKVPAVDTVWDVLHTFIRVPAGVVLAAAAIGEVPAEYRVLAGLAGGTLALGAHGAKATLRLALHGTGTSPVSGPAASVAEDGVVIGLMGLVAANPLLALVVLGLLVGAGILVVRACWRFTRRVFGRRRSSPESG